MIALVETNYDEFDREAFFANLSEREPEPSFADTDDDPIVKLPPDLSGPLEQSDTENLPWHFRQPSAETWEEIWDKIRGYIEYVVIANLDTGVNPHDNLPKPVYMGSYIRGQSAFDGNGHGTHTQGTSLATNGYGVAPGAQSLVLKVLSNGGSGSSSGIAAANNFCRDWKGEDGLRVDCVNMSLGSGSKYQPTLDAVKRNFTVGILTAASAGNSGPSANSVGWPARSPECPAIGATRQDGRVATFSSRGPEILVAAPGQSIVSTSYRSRNGYLTFSGTSMSAPFITGVNAILIAFRRASGLPNWRSVEPLERVYQTYAEDRGPQGRDTAYGHGVIKYGELLKDLAEYGKDLFVKLGP